MLRRKAVSTWKHKVVVPRVRLIEQQWFTEQLAGLQCEAVVPYQLLAPATYAYPLGLLWAAWGPTTWRFFRAWCVARATGRIPLGLWDCGQLVRVLDVCPLCGMPDVGLLHIVAICAHTGQLRQFAPVGSPYDILFWVLAGSGDTRQLHSMVSQLGLSVAAVVRGILRPVDFPQGDVFGLIP